jgi:hypothetical protein
MMTNQTLVVLINMVAEEKMKESIFFICMLIRIILILCHAKPLLPLDAVSVYSKFDSLEVTF